jgi:hypothetical protein
MSSHGWFSLMQRNTSKNMICIAVHSSFVTKDSEPIGGKSIVWSMRLRTNRHYLRSLHVTHAQLLTKSMQNWTCYILMNVILFFRRLHACLENHSLFSLCLVQLQQSLRSPQQELLCSGQPLFRNPAEKDKNQQTRESLSSFSQYYTCLHLCACLHKS